jgi:hypothetical protein
MAMMYDLTTMGRLGAAVAGTDPCSTGGHPNFKGKRRLQMNKFRFTIKILAIAIFTFAFASMAQAQATRTWVSGVGDDANPCSRTAPCKTFAGAMSKTAINGEIDVLDPGGFGVVTITKGITIDGGAALGSILATGSAAGIVINTQGSSGDIQKVILRRLSINGTGGSNGSGGGGGIGVRIIVARNVSVENCFIFGFTTGSGRGISDERTFATSGANSILSVTDTVIENNGGDGIGIVPSSGNSPVRASIDHLLSYGNTGTGIKVTAQANCTISNSVTSGSTTGTGIEADSGCAVDIESTVTSNNSIGVLVQSAATVRLSNVNVSQNTTGVNNAGTVRSFGNNKIDSNSTNTTGTAIQGPGSGGPSQQ